MDCYSDDSSSTYEAIILDDGVVLQFMCHENNCFFKTTSATQFKSHRTNNNHPFRCVGVGCTYTSQNARNFHKHVKMQHDTRLADVVIVKPLTMPVKPKFIIKIPVELTTAIPAILINRSPPIMVDYPILIDFTTQRLKRQAIQKSLEILTPPSNYYFDKGKWRFIPEKSIIID